MSQYPNHPSTGSAGQTNTLALVALICGVVGILFPPIAIVAIILAIIAMTKPGPDGRGMAVAGLVLGIVGLVIGLIITLLIAIMVPALSAARSTAQQMQNQTQLRGIHQSLVTFANSNRNYYSGLDSSGNVLPDGIDTGNSGAGDTPMARYWILLDGDFFTPEYAISPGETVASNMYPGTGPVLPGQYAYAMLDFEKTSDTDLSVSPPTQLRAKEWSQTINSQAIVMSDRNTGSDTQANVQSVWSDPGQWQGAVLWNDNHVDTEYSHIITIGTKYDWGNINGQDNLFEDDTSNGANAVMVVE